MTASLLHRASKFALLLTVFMVMSSSCKTHEKLVYFQETVSGEGLTQYTPTFKKDDLLAITVSAADPVAVAPFNQPVPKGMSMGAQSGYSQGNTERLGYLIDANGEVQLPGLGTVKLAGLTRIEATALLTEKISTYVEDPVVNIQILNFKVTVLGEVQNPGTFKIPNERMTLLEAIGLAGDLKMTGVRNNVLVIRDNDGSKQEFRVDLTDTLLFNSPAYYLQQNDVVYVEPNAAARTNASFWRATGSVFISLASLIVTTAVLITN